MKNNRFHAIARVQLHEQKEMPYSHECFHNISVFVLSSCLDVPQLGPWTKKLMKLPKKLQPFKRQSHKMVKHTQTIRRQFTDELFECVWPFCDIGP